MMNGAACKIKCEPSPMPARLCTCACRGIRHGVRCAQLAMFPRPVLVEVSAEQLGLSLASGMDALGVEREHAIDEAQGEQKASAEVNTP